MVVPGLTDTVASGLIGAAAGLLGALVGGAASFGGTWWAHRTARRVARIDSIRSLVSEYLQHVAGAPVRLAAASDREAFDMESLQLRSALWSPRAQLGLYPEAERITDAMANMIHGLALTQFPLDDDGKHELQAGLVSLAGLAAAEVAALEDLHTTTSTTRT